MKIPVPFQWFPPFSPVMSDVPSKVAHPTFEGLGDFRQCFKGDFLFGPLNVPNIIPRHIGLFRKLFLTQTKFFPAGADGCAHGAVNFSGG